MNDKVSILIPCYNSEKYISETLECAINQTWQNKEIIVVDDDSTDNSYNIAKQYESDIVKVYKQKKSGACVARNFAFEKSTGDYIQYLDADDLMSADKIEKQMNIIVYYRDVIVSCAWSEFYKDISDVKKMYDKKLYHDYEEAIDIITDMWTYRQMMPIHAWLTPKNIILKANGWDGVINQDGIFFLKAIIQSKRILFCKDAYVYYRRGISTSLSMKNNWTFEKRDQQIEALKKYLEIVNINKQYKLKNALVYVFSDFLRYVYKYQPKLYDELLNIIICEWGKPQVKLYLKNKFSILVKLCGINMALRINFILKKYIKT